jgi:hypothetical protein
VLYQRIPRMFADLALANGDGRYARLMRALGGVKLLILDDWGLELLSSEQRRDLLEIAEDRYELGATPDHELNSCGPADINRNSRPTSIGMGGRHQAGITGRLRRNAHPVCALGQTSLRPG